MWQDRNVYYRDFAYSTRRLRMANGSIGDVPAGTFAEYVNDPFLELPNGDGDGDAASSTSSRPQSRCLALRPGLAHRLYSHQLHVRAKAKLQRDRLLSGPMIDIYVGEARRHWALHRNLLCHHSEILEAELEGDGKDSKRKDKLELPEHDPAGFELLVKWLYQGKLDDVSDLADANQKYDYAVSCHKLYLLCDRLDMPQLKNVAMDQYRKGLNQAELVPDADEIDEIYRKSPSASPFRQLMTRIAARQIMDPDSERDVETYRQCFGNNPDFAIDLVKAIKHGTGGMLFEDPTESGNPCDYHDHEDGPNCHIKGKGKLKQARKTSVPRPDLPSTRSTPYINSDQLNRHPLPPHPKTPHQPPPRQARPQDGTGVGPLRRRLTSPAISTVGTSPETAVATLPPNPDASKDREKWRKVTPPERRQRPPEQSQSQQGTKMPSHPAPEERLPSSDGTSHPSNDGAKEAIREEEGDQQAANSLLGQTPSRRRIWEWARAGTGRLSIIGRIPHPEWKGPLNTKNLETATDSVTNGETTQESYDDFSIPSTTVLDPDDSERQRQNASAKLEGLGIMNAAVTSPMFSQTKQSSDELVAAASSTGTPESKVLLEEFSTNGEQSTPTASKGSPPSTPDTPTPRQRKRDSFIEERGPADDSMEDKQSPTPLLRTSSQAETVGAKDTLQDGSGVDSDTALNSRTQGSGGAPKSNTSAKTRKISTNAPSPHRIPKYKIALASNLLPSARAGATSN